jgi:hypothetical protein
VHFSLFCKLDRKNLEAYDAAVFMLHQIKVRRKLRREISVMERKWWEDLKDKFNFQELQTDPNLTEGKEIARQQYAINYPESYINFMEIFGVGTLGGFLHFPASNYLNTHKERLEPFIDEDINSFLEEEGSGDILGFAYTDNGNWFGWHLSALRLSSEPEVIHIPYRSFECHLYSATFQDFIQQIVTTRFIAGYGPIPLSYIPFL